MPTPERNTDYDSEPVLYCKGCYSLKIKYEEVTDSDYCADCGCSDIAEAPFEVWQQKYESKYGHKLAEKSDDPKSSFIFKLSLEELKNKVFNSEKCKEIIHAMYPKFPRGLSKADSVILLFDKLVKENRLSDLKLYLLNKLKR